MDRLEEFVKNNRNAFDVHEPDPSLWLKISPENKTENATGKSKRHVRSLNILRYAAAVAVIFAGISAGIYYLSGAKSDPAKIYGAMYEEVIEAESYYSGMVEQRYRELKPYFSSSPEIKASLDSDLNELDQIYSELKEDLKENVANPEVIEAMIQNYRMKVEILEDLLSNLKEKEDLNYEEGNELSL